jgi:hypothetical protein
MYPVAPAQAGAPGDDVLKGLVLQAIVQTGGYAGIGVPAVQAYLSSKNVHGVSPAKVLQSIEALASEGLVYTGLDDSSWAAEHGPPA